MDETKKEFINEVVDEFYRQATVDILIGHQFRKIALKESTSDQHPLKPPLEAFLHHLPRIKFFWYTQLLGYRRPSEELPFDLIKLHRELYIRMGELNRWLVLFHEVLKQELLKRSNQEELLSFAAQWTLKVSLFEKRFKALIF